MAKRMGMLNFDYRLIDSTRQRTHTYTSHRNARYICRHRSSPAPWAEYCRRWKIIQTNVGSPRRTEL